MLIARLFGMIRRQIYGFTRKAALAGTLRNHEARSRSNLGPRWNRVRGAASEPDCIEVAAVRQRI